MVLSLVASITRDVVLFTSHSKISLVLISIAPAIKLILPLQLLHKEVTFENISQIDSLYNGITLLQERSMSCVSFWVDG